MINCICCIGCWEIKYDPGSKILKQLVGQLVLKKKKKVLKNVNSCDGSYHHCHFEGQRQRAVYLNKSGSGQPSDPQAPGANSTPSLVAERALSLSLSLDDPCS